MTGWWRYPAFPGEPTSQSGVFLLHPNQQQLLINRLFPEIPEILPRSQPRHFLVRLVHLSRSDDPVEYGLPPGPGRRLAHLAREKLVASGTLRRAADFEKSETYRSLPNFNYKPTWFVSRAAAAHALTYSSWEFSASRTPPRPRSRRSSSADSSLSFGC